MLRKLSYVRYAKQVVYTHHDIKTGAISSNICKQEHGVMFCMVTPKWGSEVWMVHSAYVGNLDTIIRIYSCLHWIDNQLNVILIYNNEVLPVFMTGRYQKTYCNTPCILPFSLMRQQFYGRCAKTSDTAQVVLRCCMYFVRCWNEKYMYIE